MRNHDLERQMANDLFQDWSKHPWRTERDTPAGNVGYCGPENEPEPTNEEEAK